MASREADLDGGDLSDLVPRSIGRALDLLETVLAQGSCNLTTAAQATGLTPTTALRHLRALEARGYLDRDGQGLFSGGATMLRLAAALHEQGPLERLVGAAQPYLDALAAETGESTYLAVSDGRVVTYVATAESDRAIRHVGWVGQNVPIDGTAVGEALATPGVVATRSGAVEPDITAISLAVPVDQPMGVAISVIGPAHRLDAAARTSAAEALTGTVRALAHALGFAARDEAAQGDVVAAGGGS